MARRWKLWIYALLALSGGSVCASAGERVFGQEPIPRDGLLATMELYTEDKPLGSPTPIKVSEGKVRIGKWEILSLPPRAREEAEAFYLVRVPFTLDLLTTDRKFKQLHLAIELEGGQAFDLFPREIASQQDQRFTVSPTLRFSRELEPRVTEVFRLVNLRPRAVAAGSGQPDFYWHYESAGDQGIGNGDHHVFFILAVPAGRDSVDGRISAEAVLAKELLLVWMDHRTLNTSLPVLIDLRKAVAAPGGSVETRSKTTSKNRR